MALPVNPPIKPMLASPAKAIPEDRGLVFEPKWDGFRCLVFRDGAELTLQSRSGKPLNRYFPEMLTALAAALPDRVVLDGELVVDRDGRLDFDALSERIHPAASRVRLLAEQTPARYIAFDVLALSDDDLMERPGSERRARLVEHIEPAQRLHVTPATDDPATARAWFTLFEGAGLDGVIGKPADGPYTPNKRTMLKFKHTRTADCVVAGLRWHLNTEPGTAVGSLLLGLYDDNGVLHHVGVAGAFPVAQRKALAEELLPLTEGAERDHPWIDAPQDGRRLPGGINRWRSEEQQWLPMRPERVVEVQYEHTEGGQPARFRHNGQFVRWRPDREPESCRYDQLEESAPYDLSSVLRGEVRTRESAAADPSA
jgi:ATP-dependent DNA ligase